MRYQSLFLLGGHDLEMNAIIQLLEEHHLIYKDRSLQWNNAYLSQYEQDLSLFKDNSSYKIYGIELQEDIVPPSNYVRIDHHNQYTKLPSALEGLKPILLFPVCGILIMGVVMIAVNPIVGAINTGLNNFLSSMSGTSSILLGAVLGAMMSIDMGGPFNKAAYVFGTAQLTVANAGPEQYAIMAAVMAGGMVPPLAIALCTTFFKNRFTESERKSGVVNYIMGLSFITEGAIPFAAGDPIHILPPCIVGSAVAGALSMAFKCGLPAPHGGIFVIGVITNPVQYLISVAVGAVIGMIVMSFTKKPLNK